MNSALSFSGVSKIYKRSHLGKTVRTVALDSVTLEIRRGEIFGLLGLNGAGKTTALKLWLGLVRPTEGEVVCAGAPAGSRKALKAVGYLPEVPQFERSLTAFELLNYLGALARIPSAVLSERIPKLLAEVRMENHQTRKLSECSKGMLQRVGLAQALLSDPEILLLDEPASGLDPLGTRELRDRILKLKSEGKTLLFSSHSISEVEKVADRVGILVNGKLAKILESREWTSKNLEEIFIETVRGTGEALG